jgi:3-oxoacyl-[acyl-carrier protein] reductase
VDILALITIMDTATPYLAKAGGRGSVVIFSSMAGFEARHSSPYGPYPTLKRAQVTLAKSYTRKLAPHGIRINCILPGFIDTPAVTLPDGTVQPSRVQLAREKNGAYIDSIVESIPLGRPGTVEEIAKAVIFLGSPLSSYVTGSHLVLDGGMAMTL